MSAMGYADLVFSMGSIHAAIVELKVDESINEHGKMSIKVLLDKSKCENILYESVDVCTVLYFDKNELNVLFSGFITYFNIDTEGDVYYLTIDVQTATYMIGIERRNCIYQNENMNASEIISRVLERSSHSKSILNLPKAKLKEILVQYEETDWEFIKRVASIQGYSIIVDSMKSEVRVQINSYILQQDINWDELPYSIKIDREKYSKNIVNTVNKDNYINQTYYTSYTVESTDIIALGSKLIFHGMELIVGNIERVIKQGILMNIYNLYFEEGIKVSRKYNDMLKGSSINGEVVNVQRNQVQVAFNIHDENDGILHWFPFSTVMASNDGSGWHCMPKIGEQIRIFFPVADENRAYAITNIEGYNPINKSKSDPMGDPNLKNITTPAGNSVSFIENGISLSTSGEKSAVVLTNDGKINLTGTEKISIYAGKRIQIKGKKLDISADTKLSINSDTGSSVTINAGNIELSGIMINQNIQQ
jgi:Uncharacterized protein conserved in bacteria